MFKNNFSLAKKFSLITGAAGLLGEQHAIALLEINSDIILTDINFNRLILLKKKLIQIFPESKILIFRMDVSKEKSIIQTANKLKKKNIKINILINNAAIDSKVNKNQNMTNSSKFEKLATNDWNDHLNVGLLVF